MRNGRLRTSALLISTSFNFGSFIVEVNIQGSENSLAPLAMLTVSFSSGVTYLVSKFDHVCLRPRFKKNSNYSMPV